MSAIPSHSTPRGLRLFLDSADPADWKDLLGTGLFRGITTNPLLLERAGLPCTQDQLAALVLQADDLGAREIHLQTWGRSEDEMVANGIQLAALARPGLTVALKIPVTARGLAVAARLRETDCPLTLTAVYDPAQVLLAAGFGAAYAAPYLGRINDQGTDGHRAIVDMKNILNGTGSATRLLVASLRSGPEVVQLAQEGFDTLTFSPAVARALLHHHLTEQAAADFQRAAENGTSPSP